MGKVYRPFGILPFAGNLTAQSVLRSKYTPKDISYRSGYLELKHGQAGRNACCRGTGRIAASETSTQ